MSSDMDCLDGGASLIDALSEDVSTCYGPRYPNVVLSDVREWTDRFRVATNGKMNTSYFGDRALLRRGATDVVLAAGREEEIRSYNEEYLPQVGLAPKRLWIVNEVPSGDFLDAVEADEGLMRRLCAAAANGEPFEAFSPSVRWDAFIKKISAPSLTPPFAIANELDDKVRARRLAQGLGPHVVSTYPKFEICVTEQQVRDAVATGLPKYGRVIVKVPNLASGEGQYVVRSLPDEAFERFLKDQFNEAEGMVVEEYLKTHLAFSVQWDVSPDDAVPVFFASQVMVPSTGKFDGADIAAYGCDVFNPRIIETRNARQGKMAEAWGLGHFEIEYARTRGYVGRLGMDVIIPFEEMTQTRRYWHRLGRAVKVEMNGRITAVTYAADVREALRKYNRNRLPAISMRNCYPANGISSWRKAQEALGSLNYDPRTGRGVVIGPTRRTDWLVLFAVDPRDIDVTQRLVAKASGALGHNGRP